MPCCLLFIYSSLVFCCCCVFVSFLVMSGKLKYHPSPIHRPDRDRSCHNPPPSSTHHFSTFQSAIMFLLSWATVTKGHYWVTNMLSLGLQGKSYHYILLFPLFMHYQTPHLINGQIVSVFQTTVFQTAWLYFKQCPCNEQIIKKFQSQGVNWPSFGPCIHIDSLLDQKGLVSQQHGWPWGMTPHLDGICH